MTVAALSMAAVFALAQEKKADSSKADKTPPKKISTLEASNYYGKTMIVTGKVVQVSVRPSIVYINMDKKFPDSPFTGIIFPTATNEFPNIKKINGKDIELTGKIAQYHDKPQIVLSKSNQLHVVEKADEAK
jgi:DNA/RNA endonuclease YhcR with UshA esterase domain